jgi:hypothetical protein
MTSRWIETWHLEFCIDGEPELTVWHGEDAKARAEAHAEMCRQGDLVNGINHINDYEVTCIHVTGPHRHEVTDAPEEIRP